jgi:hypothetical protein
MQKRAACSSGPFSSSNSRDSEHAGNCPGDRSVPRHAGARWSAWRSLACRARRGSSRSAADARRAGNAGPNPVGASFAFPPQSVAADLEALDANGWQLSNIAADPIDGHDLAAEHPEKLRELIDLWWVETEKYNVLPIHGTTTQRMLTARPRLAKDRLQYAYYPGLSSVPPFKAPMVCNRPHSVTAEVEVPEGGPRASVSRRPAMPAATCSTSRTEGSATSTSRSRKSSSRSSPNRSCPRARSRCATSSR